MNARLDELSEAIAQLRAPTPPQLTVADIARQTRTSVVTVEARGSLGTGFPIEDPTGDTFIITNYHVVAPVWDRGARQVDVFQEGWRESGRIVNVSEKHDLAAIRLERALPPLSVDKREPVIGSSVVVIGSPYGLDGTVVTGVVSAMREDLVQFSAPVSPGNSGGPLLDSEARVIGVVVAKVSAADAEGLSFAIPIELVCRVVVAC